MFAAYYATSATNMLAPWKTQNGRPPKPILPNTLNMTAKNMSKTKQNAVPMALVFSPETEIAERRGRLSYDEVSALLKLESSGKTQQEIADIFHISQSNVSRIVSQFKDTRILAKQRLHGAAEVMAERVIQAAEVASRRGDGSVALEVLDRVDALPKRSDGGGGARVVVIVGNAPTPIFEAQIVAIDTATEPAH